jgi:hypothetical protein
MHELSAAQARILPPRSTKADPDYRRAHRIGESRRTIAAVNDAIGKAGLTA